MTGASLRGVIISVATAQFLLPFMVAGMGPILPSIGADLGGNAMELGLVNGVYALSLSIFHLVSSRIGDMIGRRRLFMIGLTVFLTMTALTPFSPSMPVFLVCRFAQAIGVACMNTCALAILIACAPANKRGQVLGITSLGVYAGISLGPGISGLVATTLGWRYLFFGILPFGALALFLMWRLIKTDWTNAPDKPFDWRGAMLYSFGITGLSVGATWVLEGSVAYGLLAFGVLTLGMFIRSQLRTEQPILDVRFLAHNAIFLINSLASFINNSTILGATFYFSLYLQGVRGLDVFEAGLTLTVGPVVQFIFSPIAGRLADRFGPARIATIGMIIQGMGLFLASQLTSTVPFSNVLVVLVVLGFGLSLFASPNTSAVMGSVDIAHMGQASGLVGTMRTMGMLLSMVIVSVSMNIYLGQDALNPSNREAFMDAMHMNLNLFNCLNACAILCSLLQLTGRFTRKKG